MNLNIQLKSFFLASLAVGSSTASICNEYVPFGEETSVWKKLESSPSCADSRGYGYRSDGISQCKGDPTSISLDMGKIQDKQGCWAYSTQDTWTWDMQKGTDITFEAEWSGCQKVWTTPFWLTPNNWRAPQGTTGEIDFLEGGLCHGTPGHLGEKLSTAIICPDHPSPHCIELEAGDAIGGSGYFHGKIDAAGTWTMEKCGLDRNNCHLITQYPNYLAINRGTQEGSPFHFMSDLFNGGKSGQDGDGGWASCGQRVNEDTNCKYTITNIKLQVYPPGPAPSPSPSGVCDSWCAGDTKNRNEGRHCGGDMDNLCGGCSYCHPPAPSPSPSGVCDSWCAGDTKNRNEGRHCGGDMDNLCGGCSYCHSARSEL